MRLHFVRILRHLFFVAVFGSASASSPALAEFTLIDRADAWFFYTQRGVGQSNAACQVVSCVRGVCGAGATGRTQFSLYDARDGRGILAEFIAPRRARPGQTAILTIGSKQFSLRNQFRSPQFYMQPDSMDLSKDIIARLRKLERQDRLGKFTVKDPQGRSHVFTVHGINESLARMERRCTPRS